MENAAFTLTPNEDGTSTMLVNEKEFTIPKQSLDDAAWAMKMQAKANYFASLA